MTSLYFNDMVIKAENFRVEPKSYDFDGGKKSSCVTIMYYPGSYIGKAYGDGIALNTVIFENTSLAFTPGVYKGDGINNGAVDAKASVVINFNEAKNLNRIEFLDKIIVSSLGEFILKNDSKLVSFPNTDSRLTYNSMFDSKLSSMFDTEQVKMLESSLADFKELNRLELLGEIASKTYVTLKSKYYYDDGTLKGINFGELEDLRELCMSSKELAVLISNIYNNIPIADSRNQRRLLTKATVTKTGKRFVSFTGKMGVEKIDGDFYPHYAMHIDDFKENKKTISGKTGPIDKFFQRTMFKVLSENRKEGWVPIKWSGGITDKESDFQFKRGTKMALIAFGMANIVAYGNRLNVKRPMKFTSIHEFGVGENDMHKDIDDRATRNILKIDIKKDVEENIPTENQMSDEEYQKSLQEMEDISYDEDYSF